MDLKEHKLINGTDRVWLWALGLYETADILFPDDSTFVTWSENGMEFLVDDVSELFVVTAQEIIDERRK